MAVQVSLLVPLIPKDSRILDLQPPQPCISCTTLDTPVEWLFSTLPNIGPQLKRSSVHSCQITSLSKRQGPAMFTPWK